MAEKKNEKKSQVSLGVLFWIAFILLVIVVFLLNKPTITKLMRKFTSSVQKTEQTVVQDIPQPVIPPVPPETVSQPDDIQPPAPQTQPAADEVTKKPEPAADKPVTKPSAETVTPADQQKKPAAPVQPDTRTASLYFVRIDANDGTIVRTKITRQLPKSDSPLVDTITALLAGPTSTEAAHDTVTLIPEGTKLLSATVKNGTAVLNFNESFQFGTYGIQGTIGQLMQIVFTATEFSTVKNVQFLIDGQRKDYLGADGIKIGVPFSRTSFN